MEQTPKTTLFFAKKAPSLFLDNVVKKIKSYGFEILGERNFPLASLKEINRLYPLLESKFGLIEKEDKTCEYYLIVGVSLTPITPTFSQRELYWNIDDARILHLCCGLRQSTLCPKKLSIAVTRNEAQAQSILQHFFSESAFAFSKKIKHLSL